MLELMESCFRTSGGHVWAVRMYCKESLGTVIT